MGVILQGILGGFSGKVGPVVGGKWKEIDYMRSYVIPSNPNTAGQQTVRAKFAFLVSVARKLLTMLLQVYWDPFYSDMSGFNAFIKENYSKIQSGNVLNESAVITKGTLEGTSQNISTYATATGVTTGVHNKTINGNGLLTDKMAMIVYDKVNNNWYGEFNVETRNSSNITITLPSGLTATNVYTWIFFYRGTGSDFVVSNSAGDQCAAAPE